MSVKIDLMKTIQEMSERKIKPKPEPKFKCRICGCNKYKSIYGDSRLIPLGGKYYPIAYQCCGCSVVFKDIIKFSTEDNAEIKSD